MSLLKAAQSSATNIIKPRTPQFYFVVNVYKNFLKESGLEKTLFPSLPSGTNDAGLHHNHSLIITNANRGKVRFEFFVNKRQTNRLKILHGGTIASVVDLGGSLAVASKGFFATGVTTDMNITYLSSGGKLGDKVTVSATCEKLGNTLAYTTVKVYNDKGQLAARGSHTKYIKDARNSQALLGGLYKYPQTEQSSKKATDEEVKESEEVTDKEVETPEEAAEEVKTPEAPSQEESSKGEEKPTAN